MKRIFLFLIAIFSTFFLPADDHKPGNMADIAKAIALGADAIAIGHSAMMALNCNKDIPEANYPEEIGAEPGYCYHCHTGRCPVGVATQDPEPATLVVAQLGWQHKIRSCVNVLILMKLLSVYIISYIR